MNNLAKLAGVLLLGVWCCSGALAEDMSQQATEAVEAARDHNFGPVSVLTTSPLKSKEALPYFKKYATDPDQNVRAAVIDIAGAAHTSDAVPILAQMIPDHTIGIEAINALYNFSDKSFLRKNGGEPLKANLLLRLKLEGQYAENETVLLLSCFPQDAEVLRGLVAFRGDTSSQRRFVSQNVMFADVALSELGQKEALARVETTIQQGDIGLVPALTMKLDFIDNPKLLKSLLPLLKDQRSTKNGITTTTSRRSPAAPIVETHTEYWRVCDMALLGLTRKTGIDISIADVMTGIREHDPALHPRNYTGAELKVASERLSSYFDAKK